MKIEAGPSGFEPETAGFLPQVKSPVLYLAELRAQFTLRLRHRIIYYYPKNLDTTGEAKHFNCLLKSLHCAPG